MAESDNFEDGNRDELAIVFRQEEGEKKGTITNRQMAIFHVELLGICSLHFDFSFCASFWRRTRMIRDACTRTLGDILIEHEMSAITAWGIEGGLRTAHRCSLPIIKGQLSPGNNIHRLGIKRGGVLLLLLVYIHFAR